MMKWFEGNPVGMVLAAICAGMLLLSLVLAVIWSLPPSATETGSGEGVAELTLDIPEMAKSEPIEAYAVITERPVFNESRLPVIGDESADGNEDELAEQEVDAPDFELAGVVITPSIRMATLRSKDQPESLVAFEGQPLEGNFGSWQISRIEPRQVTLASGRGEEVQLKLQVHDAVIKAPPKPVPPRQEDTPDTQAQAGEEENDAPMTRAEEIRQRIAQRREELRAEAENQEAEAQAAPADYRSAIKAMINSSNRKQKPDEDDQ